MGEASQERGFVAEMALTGVVDAISSRPGSFGAKGRGARPNPDVGVEWLSAESAALASDSTLQSDVG